MRISWYGQSFFRILTKTKRGDIVKIVIDPFDESIGLKPPSLEADILLITHQHSDHYNIKAIKGAPFLISGPGEYEVKKVFIQGTSAFHDKEGGEKRGRVTIYSIKSEDMTICHLGDLGQPELTSEQLDQIGDVDILMTPVGGVYTISAKEAAKIVSQLEPNLVIPMHYSVPKLKIKLDALDKFLKVMGIKKSEKLEKLSIKKNNLPTDGTKVIVLNM